MEESNQKKINADLKNLIKDAGILDEYDDLLAKKRMKKSGCTGSNKWYDPEIVAFLVKKWSPRIRSKYEVEEEKPNGKSLKKPLTKHKDSV